jgi:hypothetical protein
MTSSAADNQLRTALVVLASPSTGAPAKPEAAARAQKWFSAKGFDVDPVVGIAFAISGPAALFGRTLGITADGSTAELGPAALHGRVDAEVLANLTAIVVGPPPDFGPGNP